MNNITPAQPTPQPPCVAFAPLLPLLNAGELNAQLAASVRDHLTTCAWCRAQLAGYDVIEAAARRHYAGTPAATPLFHFEESEMMLDAPTAPVYEPVPARPTVAPPPSSRSHRLPTLSAIAAVLLVAALAGMLFARQNAAHPGGHSTVTSSAQGTIVEYQLAYPNKPWLSSPGKGPTTIVAGADGNLWFAFTDAIDRITPAGHVQAFAVPTANSNVWGIARAADGTLWFTETQANRIGSIDTHGTITEYPALGRGQPLAITVARDGSIWYTTDADSLVQLTPHGTTQFTWTSPVAYPGLNSITVGPDGNLWFTESNVNRIGRLIPTNDLNTRLTAFKEFELPRPDSAPLGITTGPDGNLWFLEANRIGRINPTTGAVTEFPLPTPDAGGLSSITAGPDGNLWFTEYLANRIGRITPTGEVKVYPLPTPQAGLSSITAGPDGNLWFTEYDATKIGRIQP